MVSLALDCYSKVSSPPTPLVCAPAVRPPLGHHAQASASTTLVLHARNGVVHTLSVEPRCLPSGSPWWASGPRRRLGVPECSVCRSARCAGGLPPRCAARGGRRRGRRATPDRLFKPVLCPGFSALSSACRGRLRANRWFGKTTLVQNPRARAACTSKS